MVWQILMMLLTRLGAGGIRITKFVQTCLGEDNDVLV